MSKNKVRRFDIEPYEAGLYFTTDRKAFLKWRAKYTDDVLTDFTDDGIACDFNSCSTHVVGVFDGRASTLAHEIGHVVMKVLEARGVPISSYNSEAFCYLLSNLIDKVRPYMGKLS